MRILYDLGALLVLLVYLPRYLFRRKFHQGFAMRFGLLSKEAVFRQPIWVHAVSVGEVIAVRPLVRELRRMHPKTQFVFSTVTPTGNQLARQMAEGDDQVVYLPLDISSIVRRVLKRVRPSLCIIAETELWPNWLSALFEAKIPVAVVNARVSDRSLCGYRLIRLLIAPALAAVNVWCCQTSRDAQRLIAIGVKEARLRITGNLKFDAPFDTSRMSDRRTQLGLFPTEALLVAGSTHAGEEEIILQVFQQLQREFGQLRLLLAPRHPERSLQVESLVRRYGLTPLRLSQRGTSAIAPHCVCILDTVGELVSYYASADIVFIGGSMVPQGGHNILEPARFAKPILFGPSMHNFRDIRDLFIAHQAALEAAGPRQLKEHIALLLGDAGFALRLGQKAKELVIANQGAVNRTIQSLPPLTS